MSTPFLLHVFSTFAVGGPQVRFATIANHFGPRWRHAIIAMDGNLAARAMLSADVGTIYPTFAPTRGDTLRNIRRIRAALAELRPDALITNNWGTIEWAMANRVRMTRHVHVEDGFGPEERNIQLRRRVWTRRLFLAGRSVVVPSLTLRRIAAETWRLNPARIIHLPNGVDLDRFGTGPALHWPGDGPVVGTVAALRSEKNLSRLIEAFASATENRTGRLVIAGDGPAREQLHALADKLGIAGRVHWAGQVADPAALLRGLDVFAMSSDTEQMPISLLEAMACGLPVAATDVGDIATMLPDAQKPYVVQPGTQALAVALGRLLDDASLRRALGSANRARAAQCFGLPEMLKRWAQVFDGDAAHH